MAGTHGTHGSGTQGNSGNLRDKAEQTGANLGAAAGRKVGETAERIQGTATTATQRAQDTASNFGQRAQDTASNLGQRAQDTASNLAQKASDAASNLTDKAQDFLSNAGDRTEEALSNVGERITNWGSQLRQSGPREGALGTAASTVAGQLEAGGRYLQQHGFSDMTDDVGKVVRNYPIQSLLVAFGIGCFFGMASRR